MSTDFDDHEFMICGAQLAENQIERQYEEAPIWEEWGDRIKEDLKRYPLISEEMREFVLEYTISAITDHVLKRDRS